MPRFREEIIAPILFLLIVLIANFLGGGVFEKIEAQQSTSTVGITAVVEAWLDFSVSPTSTTLQPPLLQADGTLNVGSSTAIALSLGTNAPNGWGITIKGQNAGLYSASRAHLISTVVGTSTIATGTEAYGANATSTLAGVTIESYYDYYGTNTVGEIASSTSHSLASKSSANSTQSVANMQVKATATDTTPPATDYSDTISLTATANL